LEVSKTMAERILNAERIEQLIEAFGSFDENISRIEQAFDVRISTGGTEVKITGTEENAFLGARAMEALMNLAAKHEEIDEQKVRYLIDMVSRGEDEKVADLYASETLIPEERFNAFAQSGNITESKIKQFADEEGIDAGIVLGRLQKYGYVQYGWYKNLKKQYIIV